jgi:hypothetical protein
MSQSLLNMTRFWCKRSPLGVMTPPLVLFWKVLVLGVRINESITGIFDLTPFPRRLCRGAHKTMVNSGNHVWILPSGVEVAGRVTNVRQVMRTNSRDEDLQLAAFLRLTPRYPRVD